MSCKYCKAELLPESNYCHICGKKVERERKRKRSHGSGAVTKLSGNRSKPYRARKDGVHIGYFKLEREAREAINALSGRDITSRYNMTFSDVYDDWSSEHIRSLTPDAANWYGIAYNQFMALYDKPFRTLRTADFQKCVDFYAYKKQNGSKDRSHSTCNKLKQLIGQMSKYAIREDIATTNYAPYIKLPENKTKPKEVFTDDDIQKLKSSKDEAAMLTLMLIYTGMRIGELFTLRYSDVHDDYCVGGEKTEAGRDRIIPIPPDAQKLFSRFKEQSAGELLIDGYSGNRDIHNFRKRDYYPMLACLGIKRKTPHCTRHTFASLAVKGGMRQEHLQKILGHASYITSADIYVHSDKDALIEAVKNAIKR